MQWAGPGSVEKTRRDVVRVTRRTTCSFMNDEDVKLYFPGTVL